MCFAQLKTSLFNNLYCFSFPGQAAKFPIVDSDMILWCSVNNTDAQLCSAVGLIIQDRMVSHKDRMGSYKDRMGPHKDRMGSHKDRMVSHKDKMGSYKDRMGSHNNSMVSHKGRMVSHKDQMGSQGCPL